jgi:hypothetical protein
MSEEYYADDLKYIRLGYQADDRFCDEIVTKATELVPGDGVLPPRWRHGGNPEVFLDKYAHLGDALWSKSSSSHLLVIRGMHVLRVWTDSKTTCIVDLAGGLVTKDCTQIPANNWRKCAPLTHRKEMESVEDIVELMGRVKVLYGI